MARSFAKLIRRVRLTSEVISESDRLANEFFLAGYCRDFEKAGTILSHAKFNVNGNSCGWPLIFAVIDTKNIGLVKLVVDSEKSDLFIRNFCHERPDEYADSLQLHAIALLVRHAQARSAAAG